MRWVSGIVETLLNPLVLLPGGVVATLLLNALLPSTSRRQSQMEIWSGWVCVAAPSILALLIWIGLMLLRRHYRSRKPEPWQQVRDEGRQMGFPVLPRKDGLEGPQ